LPRFGGKGVKTIVRWIGILAATLGTPAAAQDALVLEPSGDWTLDYAEDSCALRRTFGGGESPAWLEIMQLMPGTTYRITVSSSGLPMSRRRAPGVRFLPDGEESTYDLAAYGDYGEGFEGVAFYATILPEAGEGVAEPEFIPKGDGDAQPAAISKGAGGAGGVVLAREATATAIEVRRAFDPPVALHFGSLRRPMEAMRACMDDLKAQWDVGVAERQPVSEPVPRNMARWARKIQSFFPRGLVQFNGPSRIRVRIIVGSDGKPEKCRVVEPVVNVEYDRRTCGIVLEEAEYEPARNAAGEPVRCLHMLDIVYVLS
jgi:hypothetical protein